MSVKVALGGVDKSPDGVDQCGSGADQDEPQRSNERWL
jgi:hypothetical protein